MHPIFFSRGEVPAVPVMFVTPATWGVLRSALDTRARTFADVAGFEPKPGRHLLLPGPDGALAGVLFALEAAEDPSRDLFRPGALPGILPNGAYRFGNAPHDVRLAALAFALGSYRFGRYRKSDDKNVRLELPSGIDGDEIASIVEGVWLARDLINTPANDMGPAEIEEAARALAARHGASVKVAIGDDLVGDNFPLVHAVGRAAERAPRFIDMTWGDAAHPKITLVGKGVCFDTGGLDIKPEAGMANMKKDMGGAASVLALAHMAMARRLKLRLRVLIPAVENAISGSAFRPRDIYRSRKGITVEVGNTDAEGRLILADAMALAEEDKCDPLWRMPLWRPYDQLLESKVADVNNVASGGFAGSIVAAMFLRRLATAAKAWLHFDIYAWNQTTRPGRPEGGECQAARALYALLCARYG